MPSASAIPRKSAFQIERAVPPVSLGPSNEQALKKMEIDTLEADVDGEVQVEIAVWDDGLIGSARIENLTDYPTLVDVYVHHACRRQGVAQKIVQEAMTWSASNARAIYLFVEPSNQPARRLYEGLGWSYVKRPESDYIWMRWSGPESAVPA